MHSDRLDIKPIAILVLLALLWGANMAVIKIGTRELAPIFMAGLRSIIACLGLFIWMKLKGVPVFPSRRVARHGVMVGLLFGVEFACIYVGLLYTSAARTYVLVYTAPFWAALGAHFLLQGDRIHRGKAAGLVLAFGGVLVLFGRDLGALTWSSLRGDLLALAGGALWGATTIYVKRYLSTQAVPLQTLFYQVGFSAPLLLLLSLAFGENWLAPVTWVGITSVAYQGVVIAFLSYLTWFSLVHNYPVSLLHAFTFLTPVIGVFLSGVLILGEGVTLPTLAALALVSLGLIQVNRAPKKR